MRVTLILLFSIFLFSTCKKNELDALPPATQIGNYTFGCLINGVAWVPNGSGGFSPDKAVEGGYQYDYNDPKQRHNVWITTVRKDGSSMDIYLHNVFKEGEYLLNFDTAVRPTILFPENYIYYYDRNSNYITTSRYTGKVIVTRADTMHSILSGTFEFTGYDANTKKTISVTNGRFDTTTR